MNAATAMWESVPVRELPTIPEFDYYNAVNDSEDEENNHSSRHHNSEYLFFLKQAVWGRKKQDLLPKINMLIGNNCSL